MKVWPGQQLKIMMSIYQAFIMIQNAPGSFGGVESLYRDVKQEKKFKITRKQISDWLMSQDAYTLHKPAR